jgi:hypothetical protein
MCYNMSGSFRPEHHIDFAGSHGEACGLTVRDRTASHLEACLDQGRMDDCTSASWAARWRNVRRVRDNGTDSDFISLSLQVPVSGILRVEVLRRFQRIIWF